MKKNNTLKKVGVYLGCQPSSGGMFQYCQTILDALTDLTVEQQVTVVVIYEDPSWKKYLEDYGFQHSTAPNYKFQGKILRLWRRLQLPVAGLRFIFSRFHPLTVAIQKADCDLWLFPSQDMWPIFISKVKTVATIHDLMHRYEARFPEVGDPSKKSYREFLFSNLCKYADTVVTDSDVGKKHVLECYGITWASKVTPLQYTIPKALTKVKPDTQVLKRRGIRDDFFIFYPAQFWQHKNHINLLRAFYEVCKTNPDLKLILVGSDKNASNEIRHYITEHQLTDRVFILGYVSEAEMAGLYTLAKAMVMPTFFGPTNIPPLEASYFKCPVVYSKIYAYAEMPIEGMELVDPTDVHSIKTGIENVISSPRHSLMKPDYFTGFKEKLWGIIKD